MVQAAQHAYGAIATDTPRRETPADAAFELRKVVVSAIIAVPAVFSVQLRRCLALPHQIVVIFLPSAYALVCRLLLNRELAARTSIPPALHQPFATFVAPKVAGMMLLAVVAVVAIASTSQHMGSVQRTELEARGYDVADAILESAGVHDKKGTIPASIAALAAQAAKEKETGQLTATVELPQISKKMAAEAAEAKKEILIEQVRKRVHPERAL
eukprot:1541183-Rhodomonas_salina.2